MHRKDDDHNSHKLMMIPNQIKTQKKKKKKKKEEKKQVLLYESKSSPLPPSSSSSSSCCCNSVNKPSHNVDKNYYSQLSGLEQRLWKASGLEPLELWNSGTAAAAVAGMFSSLQLGAFEHHWANKLEQEDTSPVKNTQNKSFWGE
jgi:hypothetical protein